MSVLTRLYPRATHGKYKLGQRGFNNGWLFLRAAAKNFLLLQLLFLGLFAYVFGSLFQQTDHTHNLTIAFVDYDGPGNGAIGAAVRQAYGSLRGPSFPTLEEQAAGSFPTAADLQLAVCGTRFWGALYVMAGASGRLHDALTAPAPAAGAYDRTDAVGFIWNEARYSTVVDSAVEANVQLLSQAARAAYISGGSGSGNGTGTGGLTAVSGVAALAVLAEPWELRTTDIQPTTQGSRAIYNTLVIILILIQEFFYLGTINGLYAAFEMYQRVHPARIVFVRVLNSLTYCLVGSLCTAGAIWAFRAGWDVDGAQFGLTWMVLWLFAHVNFVTLDSFTSWLPGPYVPMALIAWVVANVTSILLPFELSPGFYRVGYAIPAHEVYQALVHIWSRGCNPQLAVALPVLFAWELAGLLATRPRRLSQGPLRHPRRREAGRPVQRARRRRPRVRASARQGVPRRHRHRRHHRHHRRPVPRRRPDRPARNTPAGHRRRHRRRAQGTRRRHYARGQQGPPGPAPRQPRLQLWPGLRTALWRAGCQQQQPRHGRVTGCLGYR